MTAAIRLATIPVGPIRVEHAAPQPLRLVQLAQDAPVLRLAGLMTIEVAAVIAPFEQSFAAAPSWTVNHNLGRSPTAVRVLTPGGVEVEAEVTEISLNQIVVQFASPQAGRVVIF